MWEPVSMTAMNYKALCKKNIIELHIRKVTSVHTLCVQLKKKKVSRACKAEMHISRLTVYISFPLNSGHLIAVFVVGDAFSPFLVCAQNISRLEESAS